MRNQSGQRGLLAALLTAACGGGGGTPYVPQPSPTCTPPGTPQIVAATEVAGPAADPGTCQRPIGRSALPGAQVQQLGTLAVNQTAHFSVPKDSGSFTIVLQAVQASSNSVTFTGSGTFPNAPVPLKVIDPSGAVFYDDANVPIDATVANAIYRPSWPGVGAFTAPNTSHTLPRWARGVPSGDWSFVVSDFAAECADPRFQCSAGADTSGRYDVTVLLRPGPLPTTGAVDFDLYLVSNRYTAAAAATDAHVARMVATLNATYAKAGLCVGKVTLHDMAAWVKTKYATGVDGTRRGPCDAMSQLFTLPQGGGGIPIFLVDDVQGAAGSGLLTVGIDGAIPGPSSIAGTTLSGALVNVSDLGAGTCTTSIDYLHCGDDETAAIVAHESGHWLGLYHPTERNGVVFGPIADTGRCPCQQCAPQSQQPACGTSGAEVGPAQCSSGNCQGGSNLMFWTLGGGDLTAQQGEVMRANPLVR